MIREVVQLYVVVFHFVNLSNKHIDDIDGGCIKMNVIFEGLFRMFSFA